MADTGYYSGLDTHSIGADTMNTTTVVIDGVLALWPTSISKGVHVCSLRIQHSEVLWTLQMASQDFVLFLLIPIADSS